MYKRSWITNFLVGNKIIEDRADYKLAILRGQFAVLVILLCIIYIILDPIYGFSAFMYWYYITAISAVITIILNRIGKYTLASTVLLLVSNILLYLIADNENQDRGIYMFFLVSAIGSIVLFFPKKLAHGIGFILLSIFLALFAYYGNMGLHEGDPLITQQSINTTFTINFLMSFTTAVLAVIFLIKRNKESEKYLTTAREDLFDLTTELKLKNSELQKANDELDKFVYSASHDLRAPLTTLLGLIEVFKINPNKKEQEKYLEMMTSRIHDMEGFIRDITEYSRNSRMDIIHLTVNMKKLLDEVRDSFDYLSNESNIKLNINTDPELEYKTDPNRLKVVVNNIVSNAIKYHDPGKEQKYVNINTTMNGGGLTIAIEDNGVGIPSEHHKQIFDMFFRASDASKGSGLGLYIVKETLEKLEGSIRFESKIKTGSKFIIELPQN
ncbi:MAG: MFS domain-containing histidine kinase [Bacteroidota bacterium]